MLSLLARVLAEVLRLSWQAAILIVVVLLVQWLARERLPARGRYNLWLLVVLRLLLPISPESSLSVFNVARLSVSVGAPKQVVMIAGRTIVPPPPATVPNPLVAATTAIAPFATQTIDMGLKPGVSLPQPTPIFPAIVPGQKYDLEEILVWALLEVFTKGMVSIWLVGAAILAIRTAWTTGRSILHVRRATPVRNPGIIALFDTCRREMKVSFPLALCETPFVKSPALFGVFRPRLLLPPGLTRHFALNELRYVFLHELAHVKRRDVAMNWLLTLLQVLHWFNPVIWFGFARLRADRELACDALAMSCAGEAQVRTYGLTLIKLLETFSRAPAPGLIGIMENRSQMKRRLRLIATFRRNPRWSMLAAALLAMLAVTGLTDAVRSSRGEASAVPAGKPLRVTVLDAETARPITDASIMPGYNRNVTFNEAPPLSHTNAEGVAIVPAMGGYTLGFGVFAPGYASRAVTWNWFGGRPRPTLPAGYTTKLERGVTLGGIVRNEAGQPLPNVHVKIKGICDPRKSGEQAEVEEYPFYDPAYNAGATTDAEGRWSCPNFSSAMEVLQLDFERADGAFRRFHTPLARWKYAALGGGIIDLAAAERKDLVCVFQSGTDVRGQVLDAAGHPLAGIKVTETDRRHPHGPVSVLETDATGRFTLPDRDPHQLQLTLSGSGLATDARIVTVAPSMPELSLTMHPAVGLRVRAVDANGAAIVGLQIYPAEPVIDWKGTTDSTGRVSWEQAPVDPITYGFAADGYGSRTVILAATGAEQTIILRKGDPPGTLFTIKADDEIGHPLKTFSVSAEYQTPGGSMDDFNPPDPVATGSTGVCAAIVPLQKASVSDFRLRIEAPGFEPYTSEPLHDGPDREMAVVLRQVGNSPLTLHLSTGQPAAGASVAYRDPAASDNSYINLTFIGGGQPGVEGSETKRVRADDAGQVLLPKGAADATVIIVHEKGYLFTTFGALRHETDVRLNAWGKLEGALTINDRPVEGQRLLLQPDGRAIPQQVSCEYFTSTAAGGRFAFSEVPAGEWTLYCTKVSNGTWPMNHPARVEVTAGETTRLAYGAEGRTVTGKFQPLPAEAEIDWKKEMGTCLLSRQMPDPRHADDGPAYEDFLRQDDLSRASRKYLTTLGTASAPDTYQPEVDANGVFRVSGIPAGSYQFEVELVRSTLVNRQWQNTDLGKLKREVVVPPAAVEQANAPLDLGPLPIEVKADAVSKRPLVAFTARTLEGQALSLDSYRGKTVLITFWASWAPPNPDQVREWKTLAAAYATDPNLVILDVSLDNDPAAARQFAQANALPGIQAQLEGSAKTIVTETLNINDLPTAVLVGPDGRLAARDLVGPRLRAAVEGALLPTR